MRTVELGQFLDANADRIVAALDDAGIVWWAKSHGRVVQFLSAGDWGTRIFVDADRLEEARRLVRDVVGEPPSV